MSTENINPFSNFSAVMKTENISVMRFQSENSVFKFLRGYVDISLMRFQSENSVSNFSAVM